MRVERIWTEQTHTRPAGPKIGHNDNMKNCQLE